VTGHSHPTLSEHHPCAEEPGQARSATTAPAASSPTHRASPPGRSS